MNEHRWKPGGKGGSKNGHFCADVLFERPLMLRHLTNCQIASAFKNQVNFILYHVIAKDLKKLLINAVLNNFQIIDQNNN